MAKHSRVLIRAVLRLVDSILNSTRTIFLTLIILPSATLSTTSPLPQSAGHADLVIPHFNIMLSQLTKSVILSAALLSLGSAAPHQKKASQSCSNAPAQQQQNAVTVGKAVYFLTNGAENSVVALPIGKDGSLSKGSVTKTGGAGSAAIDGATKEPALPDALVGQSSLTVVGNVSQNDMSSLVLLLCNLLMGGRTFSL